MAVDYMAPLSQDSTPPRVDYDSIYTAASQMNRFIQLFGAGQTHINEKKHLHVGLMAPFEDFVFGSAKQTTRMYMNSMPISSPENVGQSETIVRRLADKYQTTLDVFTGGLGIMELRANKDRGGQLVPATLANEGDVWIPTDLYKIVVNKQKQLAIVLIIRNSISSDTILPKLPCQNVCDKAKIVFNKDYKITCCSFGEFSKAFPFPIIKDTDVKGLLTMDKGPRK